jgi:hypothetical protein
MFSMKAEVLNTFSVPPSEKYPEEAYKVQFVGDQLTRDGQIRKEMVTMGIPKEAFAKLEKLIGQVVSIPIGLFVANGRIQPFFPKGYAKEISNLGTGSAS